MTIQLKRNTAAGAAANNEILADGQPGWDETNKILKIGDGTTHWNDLPPILGSVYATVNEAPLSPLRYGAAPTGGDDTATVQAALDAIDAAGGGHLDPGPYQWSVSALTYGNKTKIVGRGDRATLFNQIAGTAQPVLRPKSTSGKYSRCLFENFGILGYSNQAVGLGGLILEGVADSEVDIYIAGVAVRGVQIKGGIGGQGDAMRNTIKCRMENVKAGAAFIQLSMGLGVTATGGLPSHPDGTTLDGINLNSNAAGCIGVLVDAPDSDTAGHMGPDSVAIIAPRMQEVAIPYDITGQGFQIIAGRHEATSGTMTVYVRAGTSNFPSLDNVFAFNRWPAHGDPASFIFTDSGANTVRWGEYPRGGSSADNASPMYEIVRYSGDYAYGVRVNGNTYRSYRVRSDGRVEWGPGNTLPDTFLYRPPGLNAILRTEGELNVLRGATGIETLTGNVAGEAGRRFFVSAGGGIRIGPGDSTYDVHGDRVAAGVYGFTEQVEVNGLITPTVTKTSSYTATSTDSVILASGASTTITLLDPSTVRNGRTVRVKNTGTSPVTVATAAGNIDGAASFILASGTAATFIGDGTNWWVL